MCTDRSLTVSCSIQWGRGVCPTLPGGRSHPWRQTPLDADPLGCRTPLDVDTPLDADPPPDADIPPRRQTLSWTQTHTLRMQNSPGCKPSLPRMQTPPPDRGRLPRSLEADFPPRPTPWRQIPPPCEQNDTRLWKYSLALNFVCGRWLKVFISNDLQKCGSITEFLWVVTPLNARPVNWPDT